MSGASFETLIAQDDKLAAAGIPPLSSFWRATLRAYFDSGVLDLVGCLGRGAAKSTAMYKLATNETVFGDHRVPRGERHWATISSLSKEEAAKAIQIIDEYLTVLGVRHDTTDGVIILLDMPRGIRIIASSVSGGTGWRAYFVGIDEAGKLATDGAAAIDAREIITTMKAMTVTHDKARSAIFSTPFLDSGIFYELITRGTDEEQFVIPSTPTWIATDGRISEERTRRLAPDTKIHQREYGAQFGQSVSSAFEANLVRRAVVPMTETFAAYPRPILVFDGSAGQGDSMVWGFVQRFKCADGRTRIRLGAMNGFDGKFGKSITSDQALDRVAAATAKLGVTTAIGDTYNRFFIEQAFRKRGVSYTAIEWTNESKLSAVALVRQWLRDGDLVIDAGPQADLWIREMLSFREKLTSSGFTTYAARRGGHDDRVALILNVAMAAIDELLPGNHAPLYVAPIILPVEGSGFEGIGAPSVYVSPQGKMQTADDLVRNQLQQSARANASANDDHQPAYAIVDFNHIPNALDGF